MMGNSNAANSAAILLPPSPYGSDKSDLSPNNQTAYLEQHANNLHNEQILNNSTTNQQHNQRNQHNLQQLHYNRASPQSSPSSVVNLHSPTTTNAANLIQNLNGIPVSPAVSPVHCDDDNEQQQNYSQQQQQQLAHQQHLAHHPHLSFASSLNERQSNQGQNNNSSSLGGSLLSKLSGQPITVLQSANSSGVIQNHNQQALRLTPVSSSSSTSCINSNNLNSNLISNLASAIVSTPVAVVTSVHQQQQQLAIDCKPKFNHHSANNQVGSSTNLHLASPNGGSNSATSTADEGEEINTKELAQRISAG
jgi:hypothetical protein